jgi:hypothetical protein
VKPARSRSAAHRRSPGTVALVAGAIAFALGGCWSWYRWNIAVVSDSAAEGEGHSDSILDNRDIEGAIAAHGRPLVQPLPEPEEVWDCEVVVIGGTLGGVAAASHAMQTGAVTCLIELTPWLGGQISSQGVAAIDESLAMRDEQNFAPSWKNFKALIAQQPVDLPDWVPVSETARVADINSCWVGHLCFPPRAGAIAAEQLLQTAQQSSPSSQWSTATAFKGAEFNETGNRITAIYAVRRTPTEPDYAPQGRFSQELGQWYSWSGDAQFTKTPLRLQAPPGQRLIVIDATDTGELVGWAGIPHRLGSEAKDTTGERHGADWDNPQCTQAFTYPFLLGLHDDQAASKAAFQSVSPQYAREEHRRKFDMEGFPVFEGRSFFNYRRIVSTTRNDPFGDRPVLGDITMVNWNRGNDWTWMDPPLIFTQAELELSGQLQNWIGGVSAIALRHGEDHALLFAEWMLETFSTPSTPLTFLAGPDLPMGTYSGLSMVPYIREGRRILGRSAYDQAEFMMREADLRLDQPGGRDFTPSVVAVTHYDIDIHGCRYRNGHPSGEATSAPSREYNVRPVQIPLESLIPQGVENVLIGGKAIAVTHIVNALTRVHHGEWSVGSAAGVTAGWLTRQEPDLDPAEIVPQGKMADLQAYMVDQGLRLEW